MSQDTTEIKNTTEAGQLERRVSIGDYVLATKYSDGDPQDHWAVGFYDGITSPHYDQPRFSIVGNDGAQFRGNGFRRMKKISAKRSKWLLDNKCLIETSNRSLWWWVRQNITANAQFSRADEC